MKVEKEEYLFEKNKYIVNDALVLDVFKSGSV